jgi:hypothetical protein
MNRNTPKNPVVEDTGCFCASDTPGVCVSPKPFSLYASRTFHKSLGLRPPTFPKRRKSIKHEIP